MNFNLFNLATKTRLLIIFLGLLVGGSFLIILIFSISQSPSPQSPPNTNQTIPRSELSQVIETSRNNEASTFASFQETTIGKTTSDEILKIPNLIRTETEGDKIVYYFPSTDTQRENIVQTKNGIAIFKRVTSITSTYKTPFVEGYIQEYGDPEFEFTGSRRYGPDMKTYVYPTKGFAFIFNPYTNEVFEIQSFTPVSIEEYKNQWGQDINDEQEQTTEIDNNKVY